MHPGKIINILCSKKLFLIVIQSLLADKAYGDVHSWYYGEMIAKVHEEVENKVEDDTVVRKEMSHTGTRKVAVVVLFANPAEFVVTYPASHMGASSILVNWWVTFGAIVREYELDSVGQKLSAIVDILHQIHDFGSKCHEFQALPITTLLLIYLYHIGCKWGSIHIF